jgi:hypothetical protein
MTRPAVRFRRRLLSLLLVAACAVQGTACYTYHVYQIGGPEGREMGNQPSTEWRYKTLNSFAWGAVRQDLPVDNCKLANGQRLGIEEVKVEDNLGFTLVTVLTLGLWAPVRVGWRCAKPPVPTGTLN